MKIRNFPGTVFKAQGRGIEILSLENNLYAPFEKQAGQRKNIFRIIFQAKDPQIPQFSRLHLIKSVDLPGKLTENTGSSAVKEQFTAPGNLVEKQAVEIW